MSQRIEVCFANARQSGKTVLAPFITAGDPDPEWTVDILHSLVSAGADLIELGVPFSDPMADGPVIQAASERAIAKQVNLAMVLEMVQTFRRSDNTTPVLLMGYMNPVERFGLSRFPAAAVAAGVDALLLVDCPPEERGELGDAMAACDLDGICLVAPTTTHGRLQVISGAATGFIYYVSFKGITGDGQLDSAALAAPLARIRSLSDLPVAVGFGIKNAEMAVAVATYADAVVMGSALVAVLSTARSCAQAMDAARAFVAPVRESLDNTR